MALTLTVDERAELERRVRSRKIRAEDARQQAWESLVLVANGHATRRAKPGSRVDRAKLAQVDLHWQDLRHEGASRLLADGVDIRSSN